MMKRASINNGVFGTERTYLAKAILTSRLKSGGLLRPVVPPYRLFCHSSNTASLIWEKIPLALHSSVTAKLSFSSLALRSESDIARSCSYAPREVTTDRARLESANAYVRREKERSA